MVALFISIVLPLKRLDEGVESDCHRLALNLQVFAQVQSGLRLFSLVNFGRKLKTSDKIWGSQSGQQAADHAIICLLILFLYFLHHFNLVIEMNLVCAYMRGVGQLKEQNITSTQTVLKSLRNTINSSTNKWNHSMNENHFR